MGSNFNLGDYVEVPERIALFRDKHPDGSLQSEILELPAAYADKFIAVMAYAYRNGQDLRPGIGIAWEQVPGATPYTKNSELMNAETSAWGRAIVAVLAADTKRGVASANEVAGRLDGEAGRPAPNVPEAGGVAAQPASGTNVGAAGEGKTKAPAQPIPPTEPTGSNATTSAAPTHSHQWTQSPTMKDWEVCSCGKAQKKGDRK